MQDPGNGVVLEVLHSRQPCCMAGIMKMFCIRNNISSHGKKNLLFLPWNMAAEQNRYQASTANDQILVLSRMAARSQFRHRKLITLKQLINIFSLVLGVQICHGCISTLIHWILSFDGNSPINHPGCLHYQHSRGIYHQSSDFNSANTFLRSQLCCNNWQTNSINTTDKQMLTLHTKKIKTKYHKHKWKFRKHIFPCTHKEDVMEDPVLKVSFQQLKINVLCLLSMSQWNTSVTCMTTRKRLPFFSRKIFHSRTISSVYQVNE